jgi:sugar-phosphatase
VHARLSAAGIELPEVVVAGDDLTNGKPHPEGYLVAASRLGVPPTACAVIEDADLGITAGLAAGCHVIAVGEWATHRADQRITAIASLEQLRIITTPDAFDVEVAGHAKHARRPTPP